MKEGKAGIQKSKVSRELLNEYIQPSFVQLPHDNPRIFTLQSFLDSTNPPFVVLNLRYVSVQRIEGH